MKKFFKGRWFPLLVGILIVAVAAFVMSLLGWRITYAPELECSWDAISAVAAWSGTIVSFGAIMVAIWIPKRIADRQDKIALFEKRYECYTVIQNLLVCAEQINAAQNQTNKAVQVAFRVYLGQPDIITEDIDFAMLIVRLVQKEAILVSGEFLFKSYNTEILLKIIDTGVSLITSVASIDPGKAKEVLSGTAKEYKDKFCELCNQFDSNYTKQLEKELQLSLR